MSCVDVVEVDWNVWEEFCLSNEDTVTLPEDVADLLLDIDVITDDAILLDNDVIAVVIIDNVTSLDNVITNDIILLNTDVIIVFTDFDGFGDNGFVGNGFGGDVISIDAVISFALDFSDDANVLAVFRRDVTGDVSTYDVIISGNLGVIVDGDANEEFIAGVLFGKEFVDRDIRSVELSCP